MSLAEAMSGSGFFTGEDDDTRFLERDPLKEKCQEIYI